MTVLDRIANIGPERFGEALRNHRHTARMTQEELAERAGISPRSVSGLECGDGVTPRRDTVILLARALGLAAEERAAFEAMVVRRPAPRRSLRPEAMRAFSHPALDPARHRMPRSLTS